VTRVKSIIAGLLLAQMLGSCSAPELQTIAWRTAEATADPQVLSVGYAADRCQALHHAEVSYERTYVVLSLFTSRNDLSCTGLRFPRVIKVPLREPLAGRPVEPGAGT
jgi:hypothetical protein